MGGFGRGKDAFDAREFYRGLEHIHLAHRARFVDITVVVELAEDGAHAVISEPARVRRRRHEAAAQRVHLRKRRHPARVAEVVGELAAGERGTAHGLDGDEIGRRLAAQLVTHEGRHKSAEVAAAARAADDHVGIGVRLLHGGEAFETYHRLMEHDLIEHAAERVAQSLAVSRDLNGFGYGGAEAARSVVGMFGEHLPADGGGVRRRRDDLRAVHLHDRATLRLLLVGAAHHIDGEIESEITARHAERRAPLPRARLGGESLEPLLFCVVRLRDRAVELMAAAGVVTLELVIDLGRRVEIPLEAVRPDQRRGTVHLVEISDLVGDGDERVGVVELLPGEFGAEHRLQVL